MKGRVVSLEIERTLESGWPTDDTKPGAYGKAHRRKGDCFNYIKARYGKFPQRRLKQ